MKLTWQQCTSKAKSETEPHLVTDPNGTHKGEVNFGETEGPPKNLTVTNLNFIESMRLAWQQITPGFQRGKFLLIVSTRGCLLKIKNLKIFSDPGGAVLKLT